MPHKPFVLLKEVANDTLPIPINIININMEKSWKYVLVWKKYVPTAKSFVVNASFMWFARPTQNVNSDKNNITHCEMSSHPIQKSACVFYSTYWLLPFISTTSADKFLLHISNTAWCVPTEWRAISLLQCTSKRALWRLMFKSDHLCE